MIREDDLREAIAEMQGQKNPNAQTCIKLAAYYTILDHITEKDQVTNREGSGNDPGPIPAQSYIDMSSYSAGSSAIEYQGESEFAKAINGRDPSEVWPVIDELMTTIQVIHPRLYTGVMAKL